MARKSVCVVGAGPAGLAGAKVLLGSQRFDVTVYEKGTRIGGIWALDEDSVDGFLHPHTPTNLSKYTVGFSDLDWNSIDLLSAAKAKDSPERVSRGSKAPIFPKAWQVNRYLETYKNKNIPDETIHLGHEVIKAERKGGRGPGWKITTRDNQASERTKDFDYLMLGSGFFSKPRPLSHNIPSLLPELGVTTMHSSRFRTLSHLFPSRTSAVGKSVLVIGGGNSAGEAAAAVAQQISHARYSPDTTDREVYQDTKIVHVTPRPLYALPPFTPCDETATTFLPIDLKLYDLSKRPPGPITGNAGRVPKAVKDMIHGALQDTIGGDQSDITPALAIPVGEPRSAVYVALSESYPEYVRSGLIEVTAGRVSALKSTSNGSVTATVTGINGDSSVENIGAILCATGYSPTSAIEFLSDDIKRELHYDPDSLRLPLLLQGWQTSVQSIPDLSLLGFYEGPYWPMVEMQARLTVERWLNDSTPSVRPYEEIDTLRELRSQMQQQALDVPQYWFGDYAGYMEEVAGHLGLQRNDEPFEKRRGCVTPARYISKDTDVLQARAIMHDLHETWRACVEDGKYTARAIFRALHGRWKIKRTIDSSLSTFPSGRLEGEASFLPRAPTMDRSGKSFDFEYLYIEHGELTLANGAIMSARRRYVYRYSEERDELSVWFVKPDNEDEVDYLFHNLAFVKPIEAKQTGACIAKADHLCVEDMYWTEYRLPMKGISLHAFDTEHTVKGPSKDYVTTTKYTRSPRTAS